MLCLTEILLACKAVNGLWGGNHYTVVFGPHQDTRHAFPPGEDPKEIVHWITVNQQMTSKNSSKAALN